MKFWPFGKKKAQTSAGQSWPELAVPTHLQPFFVHRPDKGDQQQITGDIRCTCGCIAFSPVQSKDDDCLYRLICEACGKDILIFDAREHGWDAVVCHMPGEHLQLGEVTAKCEKCGGEHFTVEVWIEPTDKAEFISCVEGELPDDAWVNAFTWFAAHLTCTGCGRRQPDWADIETA